MLFNPLKLFTVGFMLVFTVILTSLLIAAVAAGDYIASVGGAISAACVIGLTWDIVQKDLPFYYPTLVVGFALTKGPT